jgi:putative FmdB family regulatory protein
MLYPYRCTECGFEKDFDSPMTAERPDRETCPECGRLSMKRTWGNSAIHVPFQFTTTNDIRYDRVDRNKRKYK